MRKFKNTIAPVRASDTSRLPPEFIRVSEAERIFGIRRGTIYNLLKSGRVKSVLLRVTGQKSGVRLLHLASLRALFS